MDGDESAPGFAQAAVDEPLFGAEAVYRQLRRWLEAEGITLGQPNGAARAGTGDEKGAVEAAAEAAVLAAADPHR